MQLPIIGLHHVTATVSEAQEDIDFYTLVLGLRLVKQTINFDNRQVYHFYYGTEVGAPGTIMTTFPYNGHNVRDGVHGAGQVIQTAFSIPKHSIPMWEDHLSSHELEWNVIRKFEDHVIQIEDPSGLMISLVANDQDSRKAWTEKLDADMSIHGLHSVALSIKDLDPTMDFFTEILGFKNNSQDRNYFRLQLNEGGPGKFLDIIHDAEKSQGSNGIGTVHHVAFAIEDEDAQKNLREELVKRAIKVTEILDRKYFKSIYFREPGGVLIEIATVEPGFTVDEAHSELGKRLELPSWEEPNREEIENQLPQIRIS